MQDGGAMSKGTKAAAWGGGVLRRGHTFTDRGGVPHRERSGITTLVLMDGLLVKNRNTLAASAAWDDMGGKVCYGGDLEEYKMNFIVSSNIQSIC